MAAGNTVMANPWGSTDLPHTVTAADHFAGIVDHILRNAGPLLTESMFYRRAPRTMLNVLRPLSQYQPVAGAVEEIMSGSKMFWIMSAGDVVSVGSAGGAQADRFWYQLNNDETGNYAAGGQTSVMNKHPVVLMVGAGLVC